MSARGSKRPVAVTRACSALALPQPGGDPPIKRSAGQSLVIGGASEVPGALLLSGVAALRAGAGKLQLAAPRSAAARSRSPFRKRGSTHSRRRRTVSRS